MQFRNGVPHAAEGVSLIPCNANLPSCLLTISRFHDHQIITSMKDAIGTELLSLPFRRDELEAIFEDLAS